MVVAETPGTDVRFDDLRAEPTDIEPRKYLPDATPGAYRYRIDFRELPNDGGRTIASQTIDFTITDGS